MGKGGGSTSVPSPSPTPTTSVPHAGPFFSGFDFGGSNGPVTIFAGYLKTAGQQVWRIGDDIQRAVSKWRTSLASVNDDTAAGDGKDEISKPFYETYFANRASTKTLLDTVGGALRITGDNFLKTSDRYVKTEDANTPSTG